MGITATDFGGHLIANSKVAVFPQVAGNPGYRFHMQSIQCKNRLDVVSVFVFFWGRTMTTMAQHFDVSRRNVQHYKNIVIEYGHFRLKITGVSRPNTIATRVKSLH